MSDSRDTIQARLLANIPDTYNKDEGEWIFDAEKPVSIELESAYTEIDGILNRRYADTATGKDLERIVKEVGYSRKVTTKSSGKVTITGIIGSAITTGELVASDSVNFAFTETTVIPSSGTIDVGVQCTNYGTIGNIPIGAIKSFPKTLAGLQTVTNTVAFANGYDEESDDSLRERYYAKVQTPSVSANKQAYKNWALECTGVTNARVVPLAFGNGTVQVIISSNGGGADATLVSAVKNYIDPVDGMGEGQAPIGAKCTVVSAIEKAINVTVTLIIDTGNTTLATAQTAIGNAIKTYLKSIAFNQNYVSYGKIGSIILGTSYVADYSNLLVNTGTINIPIADTEIAVFGGVVCG